MTFADAAEARGATSAGRASNFPVGETGLAGAAEAGICALTVDDVEFAVCCALALIGKKRRRAAVSQCQIRINHPGGSFFSLFPTFERDRFSGGRARAGSP